MNSKTKLVIGYIILFFESLLFFLITLLLILKLTIFNESYINNKLVEKKYYDNLSKEIKTEMSYYTEQSGFKDDILDDIYTKNEIKYDSHGFLKNLYHGTTIEISTKNLKNRLTEKINKYIKDNDYDDIDQEEIDRFVDEMAKIYKDEVKLMGYTDKISKKIPKIVNIIDEVLLLSICIFIIVIITNRKVFRNKDYGTILYTCSFLFILTYIYIKNTIDIKNLYFYNELLSNTLKGIINNILSIMIIVSIFYVIVGIIMGLMTKIKHRHRHRV